MVPSDTSVEAVCLRKKHQYIRPLEDDKMDDVSAEEVESDDEPESDNSNAGNEGDSDNSEASESESKFKGNPGWADVFQKILKTNKPKKKKTLVLSRAKKLSEVKPRVPEDPVTFEIDGETQEVKKETTDETSEDVKPVKKVDAKKRLSIRAKQTKDRGRERMLQKIATKGVVQLFNAVRQQQTELDRKLSEAGPLDRKKEKVLKSIDKRAFLDVLMGETKSIPVDSSKETIKSEDKTKEKVWSVLRDDFTMGAKLKDWDKNAPEEEEDNSSSAEEMDSD